MYLWNINQLVSDLRNNKVTSRNNKFFSIAAPLLGTFNACFFSIVLVSHQFIAQIFANFISKKYAYLSFYNTLGWTMGTITTIITFIGFYLCYKVNKEGDGKNFFQRLAALSFHIYFNLTLYILSFITLLFFFGLIFIHVKIMYFKFQLFMNSQHDVNLAQTLQTALQDTPFKNVLGKLSKQKSGFFSVLFKAPATIVKIPFLPVKINSFIYELRTTILTIYPFLTCLPPVLSFLHYFLIRKMMKRVAHIKK